MPLNRGFSSDPKSAFVGKLFDQIGLVDHVVPDADLDAAIDALATEIAANSPGTNRIVKALIADHGERNRTVALEHERAMPHGRPTDMAERMRAGGR